MPIIKLSIMFGQHPNLLAHHVADVQNDMSDLARHPANCSTALPEVFSRDLQVCPCIRKILNLPGVHVGCINYGLLWCMYT